MAKKRRGSGHVPPKRVRESHNAYRCPECEGATTVIDSRITDQGTRRRRACMKGHRFTTYEVMAERLDRLNEVESAVRRIVTGMTVIAEAVQKPQEAPCETDPS